MVEELKKIAAAFFRAGQVISDSGEFPYFNKYPRGWCGVLSRALGGYLRSIYPNEKIQYVCGYRRGWSHAWININGIIIDVTPGQFEFCNEEIIICNDGESEFHKKFEVRPNDIRDCFLEDMAYKEENRIVTVALDIYNRE